MLVNVTKIHKNNHTYYENHILTQYGNANEYTGRNCRKKLEILLSVIPKFRIVTCAVAPTIKFVRKQTAWVSIVGSPRVFVTVSLRSKFSFIGLRNLLFLRVNAVGNS